MAIDVLAVSYESGREALQLAIDGDGSIEDIASLLAQEAEDHLNSSSTEPSHSAWYDLSCDHHTALEVVASAGDLDAVDRLLEAGADPNGPVHRVGTSALVAAAAQGRLAVVQKLLEIGAHPDHRGEQSGASPLTVAAKAGHVEICEILVQNGADVSGLTQYQWQTEFFSPIEAAVEASSTILLELFLKGIKDVANTFDPDDLDVAIAQGNQEDSRRLLRTKEFLARAQTSTDRGLSAAAKSGKMLIMQRLLDAGADIIGPESYGTNAIAAAASGGQLQAMTKLLQTASDRNDLPAYAVTAALQSAVDAGDLDFVEPLLQNGADATRIDIRRAAAEGHLDILTYILQSGALVETIPHTNDTDYLLQDFTALQLASQHGHQAVVELFLAKGADVNGRPGLTGRTGATALQLAVAGDHLAITRRLIDAGADVNEVDPHDHRATTPLEAAARTGNMAILELLLKAGAFVDGGGDSRLDQVYTGRHTNALSFAAEAGNGDVVARLLSIMPIDDARQAAPRALHEAAENCHTDIVRQLLQQLQLEPDVNMRREDVNEPTLLQTAAANGDFEMLEFLLSEGADVNLDPSRGQHPTALQSASEWGDLAAVELLLTAGAEVNVVGSTAPPLLLAIRGGHVQIFERLLAAGADIHATAYRGQTMIEAAEDSGDAVIQDRVRAVLDSRPPPQIDQPLDRGTGPLCETCRLAPLVELFWGRDKRFSLHPSLTALRASAATGCPFCCFIWKRLGITSISMPQPSPVELSKNHINKTVRCYVKEPFPASNETMEYLLIEFPCLLGYGGEKFPITEDTSSPETYQQICTWLDTCKNEHPKCQAPSGKPFLPTRLIYLDTSGGSSSSDSGQASCQPRLVDTNGMDYSECKYIALSYRWPEDFPVEAKSSQDNVREQMRGLNTSRLPQIFNDVFQVAVRLDISYVWIDSLCIVQDDTEDWNREAALMIQIYRYAEFTVAAAVPSTNPDLGLFRHGDPSDVPSVTLPGVRDPRENGLDQDVVLLKPQKEAYGESPLISRGWCFQEREISRRIVHYTETQVLWECRTVRATQEQPYGVSEDRFWEESEEVVPVNQDWTERMLDKELSDEYAEPARWGIHDAWRRAVDDYSARHLTVFTDKFPALAGLAAATREYKPTNCRYLAGLWEDDFLQGLQWCSRDMIVKIDRDHRKPHTGTNTRYPEYVAPTWSWASVAGPVSYGHFKYPQEQNTATDVLKILDIDVQTFTNDPFGAVKHAVLTCTAGLVTGFLRERRSPGPDQTDNEVVDNRGYRIGDMSFDVPQEQYEGEGVEVVFCIDLRGADEDFGPGLVVLPTGNKENEYRRVGLMRSMSRFLNDSGEVREITII